MKRTIAISLLLIFLAGQINLTWATHYCGSFKVKSEMMIGHGHLDCGMPEMDSCEPVQPHQAPVIIENNGCCENVYYSSDSDDSFNAVNATFVLSADFFLIYEIPPFSLVNNCPALENVIFHAPPPLQPDRCTLYQVLII